jgi:hypothetical protein
MARLWKPKRQAESLAEKQAEYRARELQAQFPHLVSPDELVTEAEVQERRIEHAKTLILEDVRRHRDLDYELRWHVQREDPTLDTETFGQAISSLSDENKITCYHNPVIFWTGSHTLRAGYHYRLAAPFPDQDKYPLPPDAEWTAGAAL